MEFHNIMFGVDGQPHVFAVKNQQHTLNSEPVLVLNRHQHNKFLSALNGVFQRAGGQLKICSLWLWARVSRRHEPAKAAAPPSLSAVHVPPEDPRPFVPGSCRMPVSAAAGESAEAGCLTSWSLSVWDQTLSLSRA